MRRDVSDALAGGTPLVDMVDAATDAVTVTDAAVRARLAGAALADLAGVVEAVQVAERADRGALLAGLLDPDRLPGLAHAQVLHPAAVAAAMMKLRTVTGCADMASTLTAEAKRAAARIVAEDDDRAREAKARRAAKLGSPLVSVALGSLVASHPLPEGLVCPPGYSVRPDGVWTVRLSEDGSVETGARICSGPVLIVGVMGDVETGAIWWRLETYRDGTGWISRVVPRHECASARDIVPMATWGLPVDSTTAADLVRYLSATEAANLRVLPGVAIAARMGWHGDGYLWGREWIAPPSGGLSVHLHAPDGIGTLADGFRAAGTLSGWLQDVWGSVSMYPAVVLGVYAALVPPLYRVLEGESAPLWVMEWAGTTSAGKSTALRVAASCWGAPSRHNGCVRGWDSTRVGVEVPAVATSGLPLMLDEAQVGDPKVLARAAYTYVQGIGKARGTPGMGLRPPTRWQGVLLSTGERSLSSHADTGAGGDRVRCLTLRSSPLGGATADDLVGIETAVETHHGHVGPAVARWLVANPDRWPELRERYKFLCRWVRTEFATVEPVALRMAAYVALMMLAAEVADYAAGLPAPDCDPWGLAQEVILGTAGEAAPHVRAMRDIASWCAGNAALFEGRRKDKTPPTTGWAGAWVDTPTWTYVGFLPVVLREVLGRLRYDTDSIVSAWRDAGWVDVVGGRIDPVTAFGDRRARMIRVLRRGMDAADGPSTDGADL